MPNTPKKITVISAGAANQVATWEEDESQSLFTKYFLKGMSGEGDKKPYGNQNGKVSLRELKKYLDGSMTLLCTQVLWQNPAGTDRCERQRTLTHQLTSILPHFLASSRNETTDVSSDGFCTPVVVFNGGVSKEQQILCLRN